MNRLKEALKDSSNVALDMYLSDVSTKDIRSDIECLIKEQLISTPQGELKMKLLKILEDA